MEQTENSTKIILDLCGGTGSWSKPYKDAGYDVRVITLPLYDVTRWREYPEIIEPLTTTDPNTQIYGIFAAPPCTQFSFARTTAKTPRDFIGGMRVVKSCLEIIWAARANNKLAFWALENPQGYLRQFLGKPALSFHPYDYGDHYSKQTDIWGYFHMPTKHPVVLTADELHRSHQNTRVLPTLPDGYKPSVENSVQARRAMTPQGFAQSFFKSNR